MSNDEQRTQDELADIEGNVKPDRLNDIEERDEGAVGPDVEGQIKNVRSPVGQKNSKFF